MSDKLKTVFYEQQNYFEKMMGIMAIIPLRVTLEIIKVLFP